MQLGLLSVACLLLLSRAELREKRTPSEASLGLLPDEGVEAIEAWDEDEACSGEPSEQCALSLRQLRGRAKRQEVQGHRKGEAPEERRGAAAREPDDWILGVPLYTHTEQAAAGGAADLGDDMYEEPASGQPRSFGWMVNMVPDGETLDAAPDSGEASGLVRYVQGSRKTLERELSKISNVHFVEEDTPLRAVPELDVGEEVEVPRLLNAGPGGDGEEEDNPPASWGLDRIDAKDGLDHWYEHAGYGGKGAHVYMLDTGIVTTHEDFGGRAVPTLEVDAQGLHLCNATNASCALDNLGHGTHTAGTVAGHLYGVAKAATLHACKTLDNHGTGMISWMVQALDWVVSNAERPAIISASLGGHYDSPSLTKAIERSVEGGITVVVAAGNENDDACKYMPAKVPAAITVGATAVGDARAPYSNYGSCLDIFAPGSTITSAGITSPTATQKLSGTSMACPHVAGAVALLLAKDPTRTPADIFKVLMEEASPDKVFDVSGSPNLLLYTEPPNPRPVPLDGPSRFEVYDGPCQVDANGCVSNSGFPEKGYSNSEHCDILVHGDVGHVHVDAFETERSFDTLIANFKRYSGTLERGNARLLECVKPVGAISWTSDRTDTSGGWKLCPEQKPSPAALATPGFFVGCGSCTVDAAGCVSSPNYPKNYTDHGACYIDVVGDVEAIKVQDFDTETEYDKLWVNGQNFSGSVGPAGVKPTEQLVWSSDAGYNSRGWKLCPGTAK